MNGLLIFLALLGCGYVFGRAAERAHYKSILQRETDFSDRNVTSSKHPDLADHDISKSMLVQGAVVISVDYFKKFLAALKNLVGGQLSSYETLLDRARREAVLRMIESCPGADQIINVRIETSSITKGSKNQIGCVEVLAYGTAIFSQHSKR